MSNARPEWGLDEDNLASVSSAHSSASLFPGSENHISINSTLLRDAMRAESCVIL